MTEAGLTASAAPGRQLRSCPACQHQFEVDPSFRQWCPACEWNISSPPVARDGLLARRRARRADRLTRRLYTDIRAAGPGSRDGHGVRLAAWLLVAFIHALTLATAAAAVLLIFPGLGLWLPMRLVGAALLGGIALEVQPFRRRRQMRGRRSRELRPGGQVALHRTEAPELCPQERVALLGHGINGDIRRTVVTSRALTSLRHWRLLLEPRGWRSGRSAGGLNGIGGAVGLAEVIAPLFLLPFALVVESAGGVLGRLAGYTGQRSEYRTDKLSAVAAGSAAAASLVTKFLIADACRFHVRYLRQFKTDADFWAEVSAFAAAVPELEWDRLSRLAGRELASIDNTHPPTTMRAALIREWPQHQAAVALDGARSARIDRELGDPAAQIAARLRA